VADLDAARRQRAASAEPASKAAASCISSVAA
jgi:hypothetical protein